MQAELVDGRDAETVRPSACWLRGAVDRLYAIARLLLRDTELAEDATQEALVRAWRDLPTLRDVERFDAWLYRLIVRASTDIGRHRRRWRTEITIAARRNRPSPIGTSALADRDQLERGLRRLTDAQQTILVLHFYVGLSPSEAADALEIPVGTAKSRLHYAIEALRAAIAADERTVGRGGSGGPDGMNANATSNASSPTSTRPRPRRGRPTGCCGRPSNHRHTPQRRVVIRVPWRFPQMNIRQAGDRGRGRDRGRSRGLEHVRPTDAFGRRRPADP